MLTYSILAYLAYVAYVDTSDKMQTMSWTMHQSRNATPNAVNLLFRPTSKFIPEMT